MIGTAGDRRERHSHAARDRRAVPSTRSLARGARRRARAAAAVAIISPTRAAPRWSAAKPRYWTWTCTSAQSRPGGSANHDGGTAPWARSVARSSAAGATRALPQSMSVSPRTLPRWASPWTSVRGRRASAAVIARVGAPGQQRALGVGELPLPGARQAAAHGDQRAVAQRRPPRRVDDGDAAGPSAEPVRVHRGEGAPHPLGHRIGGAERRAVHERQHQPVRARPPPAAAARPRRRPRAWRRPRPGPPPSSTTVRSCPPTSRSTRSTDAATYPPVSGVRPSTRTGAPSRRSSASRQASSVSRGRAAGRGRQAPVPAIRRRPPAVAAGRRRARRRRRR